MIPCIMSEDIAEMKSNIKDLAHGQNELSVNVAVMSTNVENIGETLRSYVDRKEETDKDQYVRIDALEHNKADKQDIKDLISTIKWAVGFMVATAVALIPFIIK